MLIYFHLIGLYFKLGPVNKDCNVIFDANQTLGQNFITTVIIQQALQGSVLKCSAREQYEFELKFTLKNVNYAGSGKQHWKFNFIFGWLNIGSFNTVDVQTIGLRNTKA